MLISVWIKYRRKIRDEIDKLSLMGGGGGIKGIVGVDRGY